MYFTKSRFTLIAVHEKVQRDSYYREVLVYSCGSFYCLFVSSHNKVALRNENLNRKENDIIVILFVILKLIVVIFFPCPKSRFWLFTCDRQAHTHLEKFKHQ